MSMPRTGEGSSSTPLYPPIGTSGKRQDSTIQELPVALTASVKQNSSPLVLQHVPAKASNCGKIMEEYYQISGIIPEAQDGISRFFRSSATPLDSGHDAKNVPNPLKAYHPKKPRISYGSNEDQPSQHNSIKHIPLPIDRYIEKECDEVYDTLSIVRSRGINPSPVADIDSISSDAKSSSFVFAPNMVIPRRDQSQRKSTLVVSRGFDSKAKSTKMSIPREKINPSKSHEVVRKSSQRSTDQKQEGRRSSHLQCNNQDGANWSGIKSRVGHKLLLHKLPLDKSCSITNKPKNEIGLLKSSPKDIDGTLDDGRESSEAKTSDVVTLKEVVSIPVMAPKGYPDMLQTVVHHDERSRDSSESANHIFIYLDSQHQQHRYHQGFHGDRPEPHAIPLPIPNKTKSTRRALPKDPFRSLPASQRTRLSTKAIPMTASEVARYLRMNCESREVVLKPSSGQIQKSYIKLRNTRKSQLMTFSKNFKPTKAQKPSGSKSKAAIKLFYREIDENARAMGPLPPAPKFTPPAPPRSQN
ncbi:hypothetical protein BGX27_009811 [Mortierella sp. AM989]|nr:hypothetical protein BGX27_009811 [Mortierella sp. AM989]